MVVTDPKYIRFVTHKRTGTIFVLCCYTIAAAYRKKRIRVVHYTQSKTHTHARGIVVTATIIQSDLDESNDDRKVR